MATSRTWLHTQAAYLFRQAAEAHRKGNAPLADALTKGACRCLDRLAEQENAAASAPVKPEQFRMLC